MKPTDFEQFFTTDEFKTAKKLAFDAGIQSADQACVIYANAKLTKAMHNLKVYVVQFNIPYEGSEVEFVFSSEKKAKEKCDELNRAYERDSFSCYYDYTEFNLE